MPTMYNITLKEGGSQEEYDKVKETAVKEGGKIMHEYSLIKGFTVEFPNDTVHTLKTNDHVHVEQDGEARAN